ncbi:MAG TPA: nitrophenyl compound nitroreductase subunit ArsF family protein [Bacteroidales bacterium]|nr:nitrophenyl compound nitroreductase subunit ArsF family protein [Bacteroidales bacterium]
MKLFNFLTIAFIAISINFSCTAQANKDKKSETKVKAEEVEVFYFHYTRRCATCNALEDVAREATEEYYGNDVFFASYNLDEADGKQKAEELGISGQTLMIVSGENKINITNEGFMNARTNPEKLKQIIKEKIDSLQ